MRTFKLIVSATLALTLGGCAIVPHFTTGYPVDRSARRPEPLAASLAVKRFEEKRPPRVYTTWGRMFLTYVPLLPYVTLPFERLDESVQIQSDGIRAEGAGLAPQYYPIAPDFQQYTYPASIARAIADDLGATGLFESVTYVGEGPTDGYRYVLSGDVIASPLRKSVTSFGLGFVGVLLWFVPVPMEKTTASLTVQLTMTDTDTNTVIWSETLEEEFSRTVTLYGTSAIKYGGMGFNILLLPSDAPVDRNSLFSWHFESLRREMIAAKPRIAAALPAH